MAIFKSTLLSDVRGSLNGTVFSRTRAGNILRNRTQPVNPNTPAQATQRSLMQVAVDGFNQLTQSEVDEWADAISGSGFSAQNALGDSYVPSAKQVFTMTYLNLQLAGIASPPDVSKFLANPNLPDVSIGAITLTVSIGPPVALFELSVEVGSSNPDADSQVATTGILRPTIRNYKKYLRTMGTEAAGTIIAPVSNDVSGAFNAKYPSIIWGDQVGNVIGIAVRTIDRTNGLASAWIYPGTTLIPAAA